MRRIGPAALLSILTLAVWPGLSSAEPTMSMPANESAAREPLFDGLGAVHRPVTTKSPLAQKYFDQGLAFAYGFNHDEAGRSFQEAARIDPEMPMAYWGTALVLGPNYNLPGDKERGKRAYHALEKAESIAGTAKPVERDLIAALKHRYGADGEATAARDKEYAAAMRSVAHRYPDDPDVQTLFAESLMDLHPWQLWNADGTPGPDTVEIVSTLETVLKAHPDHTGANHYYIHAVEASRDPGRALASADRLAKLAPKAGHLVHMPSHIYIRTGRYQDSAETNVHAIEVDRDYVDRTKASGVYPLMYYTHNVQFLCYSAMMEGRRQTAARAARELESLVPENAVREMPMGEYLVPQPYFVEARFAQWDEILKERAPPRDFAYTMATWHYARGLAFAAKGQRDKAQAELKELDAITAATPPDRVVGVANHAKDILAVASAVLSGEIAAYGHNHDDAIRKLGNAVRLQDGLVYDEPPSWYFPVREALGTELLAAAKFAEAEKVYSEDLALNPENPRSLYGLARSLRAEGETKEAEEVQQRFEKAWRFADVSPPELEIISRADR